jgi:hypothetical protein
VDVLVHACGDWDLAWELEAGVDYDEAWIYGYHERLHHWVPDTPGPRRGVGTLYVVRLRPGRQEAARRTGQERTSGDSSRLDPLPGAAPLPLASRKKD